MGSRLIQSVSFLSSIVLLLAVGRAETAPLTAGPQVQQPITVLHSSSDSLRFVYRPGRMTSEPLADGSTRLSFENADNAAQPGEFDLPVYTVRVGLPPHASARLVCRAGGVNRLAGITPTVVPLVLYEGGSVQADSPSKLQPEQWASLVDGGRLRGVDFVTVVLHPVRFGPTGDLETASQLDVTVQFVGKTGVGGADEPLVARSLLNGELARAWSTDSVRQSAGWTFWDRGSGWLKVSFESTGIYVLTREELARAGVPVLGVDPRTFALYGNPEHRPNEPEADTLTEIPIVVTGESDGSFDRQDRIIFYARGADYWQANCSSYVKNLYTTSARVWLTWGGRPGRRMKTGLAPDTAGARVVREAPWVVHRERDYDCPARSGLLWIWSFLYKPPGRPEAVFETELALPDPIVIERISGRLLSGTSGNQLSIRLNGRVVASREFGISPPSAPYDFTVDSLLVTSDSRNILALGLSGDGAKGVYVDYFDVKYRRRLRLKHSRVEFLQPDTGRFVFRIADAQPDCWLFEVTEPFDPKLVSDLRFDGSGLVFCWRVSRPAQFTGCTDAGLRRVSSIELRSPGRLRQSVGNVDYWIIAPAEFAAAAERLAEYRTGRIPGSPGGRAAVALLEEVYDEYAFGMAEPIAVKRFLADKRPGYALLVGDATCDYRGLLAGVRPPGVPAYEVGYGLDPETYDRSALALDAWYADFEGEGGSPDVILGRVTARSGVELRRFVDKLISYENEPVGRWADRYLLVADDEFLGIDDPADQRTWDPLRFLHIGSCEYLAALAGERLQPIKVYLTEYPFAGVKNKPGAQAALLRELETGSLVMVFVGHGSGFDLTHEKVLTIANIPALANAGRTPFCYFGSCSVGRFDDTQSECIAEELVRIPAGAIAAVGATKATTSGSNQVFARNLLSPLFAQTESTLGAAFFRAWPTDRIYHFFGDPATRLRLSSRTDEGLAMAPETLRPAQPFRVRGVVTEGYDRHEWTLYGPQLRRTYRSFLGETDYLLPGAEFCYGSGRVREGEVLVEGRFQSGVPLDTVFVANGWYAPLPVSVRLRALLSDNQTSLCLMLDSLAFVRAPAPCDDSSGPIAEFRLGDRLLADWQLVPAEFQLGLRLADSSGIAVASYSGVAPEFWVNNRRSVIDLSRLLVFDEGTTKRAALTVPVHLTGPVDSIFVAASDNCANRTVAVLRLRTDQTTVLRVESLLVWPNPVAGPAMFTFSLSRAATVRVRIYTLAGRLVRDLGTRLFDAGYGEFWWDGRDSQGLLPANGVYIYAVTAEVCEPGDRRQRLTVRDRLLVHR